MARLVTKFKYLKPNQEKPIGGYATYIATREGVEKIDESFRLAPASKKQKKFIEKILQDFPDSKEMLEYEDYKRELTVGAASEFITRAIEDNACEVLNQKTYADYIGTRPRAERFGSHGLFTDDGVQVRLNEVSQELNIHGGNVWTLIVSLRREDAECLGFNNGIRWRDMLRTQTETLADSLKIPMEHLRWYAAFHNESHHPHVHLLAYSTLEKEGFLTKQGVKKIRASLAKDIFSQDLLCIYEKQTVHRDELRLQGRRIAAEIVARINAGTYDNLEIEDRLLRLADRLSRTKGKKVYGYLKADVKALIDSIVDTLAEDERIAALYNLWYEQKEAARQVYTEASLERVPLSQNREFKPIKNAIIQEAMHLHADQQEMREGELISIPDEPLEKMEPMPSDYTEPVEMDGVDASSVSLFAGQDVNRAIEFLMAAAKKGHDYAMYTLGKLFLEGKEVPKNLGYALRWLEESAEKENSHAEYLLGKTLLLGEDAEQNISRAVSLLEKSIAGGNASAAYVLGKALLEGTALLRDIPKAVELLTFSADKGFSAAQYLLGKIYASGELFPKDIPGAIEYLTKAATQDHEYAQYLLGKLYLAGEGISMDVRAALLWFQKAAKQGNSFASYQIGKLFLYGREVTQDIEKAISYLTVSADQGNVYAAQTLASIKSNRNWSAALGSLRLLQHLSQMLQTRINDEYKGGVGGVDWKLRRKIDEKKQAHGLKQG